MGLPSLFVGLKWTTLALSSWGLLVVVAVVVVHFGCVRLGVPEFLNAKSAARHACLYQAKARKAVSTAG